MRESEVKVNGQIRMREMKDNELLLDLLRDRLEVKSVKAACWRGECGVCTAGLNGEVGKACFVRAAEPTGGEVVSGDGGGGAGGGGLTGVRSGVREGGGSQRG